MSGIATAPTARCIEQSHSAVAVEKAVVAGPIRERARISPVATRKWRRGLDDRRRTSQPTSIAEFARFGRPVLVNGTAGALAIADGAVFSVMAFTVVRGKIFSIDVLVDPHRVAGLDLVVLDT